MRKNQVKESANSGSKPRGSMLPNWAASPNRPKSLGRMGRTPVSPHLPSGRPPRFGLPPPPAASALYCTPFAQIFGSQLFKSFQSFKHYLKLDMN